MDSLHRDMLIFVLPSLQLSPIVEFQVPTTYEIFYDGQVDREWLHFINTPTPPPQPHTNNGCDVPTLFHLVNAAKRVVIRSATSEVIIAGRLPKRAGPIKNVYSAPMDSVLLRLTRRLLKLRACFPAKQLATMRRRKHGHLPRIFGNIHLPKLYEFLISYPLVLNPSKLILSSQY